MTETNARHGTDRTPGVPRDHVVVGVDGSQHSIRALDRAADEAGRRGVGLLVLCGVATPRRTAVPETDTDREYARSAGLQVAEAAAQRARERVHGLTVVPSGSYELAADALVRASRTALLTVVGSRGRGGFRGLLLGSVGLRLAAHAASPLLVVRGDEAADAGAGVRETVVGLKYGDVTVPLEFGLAQAERDGSPLRVMHAWTHPTLPGLPLRAPAKPQRTPAREAREAREAEVAEDMVRGVAERFAAESSGVQVLSEAHHGPAAEHLIELSRGARTVVIGTRRTQRRLSLQVSPVVNTVLHHARCPVALVPFV
ncbi:universal stress protein [Streptomyces boncukensis]|uniref:Universal stress protein n=1 Tax=Streptomyces boncukensis TaxID=2711219 RepID=A0A6G4WRU7_9ACTN|nr:universal stress protein [Streptomyces boncukensis]NGO67733.1 universal stress protein [Streptomyces boncukensis]